MTLSFEPRVVEETEELGPEHREADSGLGDAQGAKGT